MDDAFVCKLAEEARRIAEDFSIPVEVDIAVRVCAHLDGSVTVRYSATIAGGGQTVVEVGDSLAEVKQLIAAATGFMRSSIDTQIELIRRKARAMGFVLQKAPVA